MPYRSARWLASTSAMICVGGVIRRVGARHTVGDKAQHVGKIAVQGKCLRLDRSEIHGGVLGHRVVGNVTVQLLDLGQGGNRLHVTDDDQDGVAGRVPLLVKVLQRGAGGGVEGRPSAQGIVRIRSAGKHVVRSADR